MNTPRDLSFPVAKTMPHAPKSTLVGALFTTCLLLAVPLATSAQSGTILSQSTTGFVAGQEAGVYVTVEGTGTTCDMGVKAVSVPSGWSVNNGAWVGESDDQLLGSVGSGQQENTPDFNVTPPSGGGSATLSWELWEGHYDFFGGWHWDQRLASKGFPVTALSKPGPFSLNSPPANATGVSPTPAFSWGSSSGATSYQIVVAGDLGGSPDPTFDTKVSPNVGNVTSWTYPGNPTLQWGWTLWWHVLAINAAGQTEDTGSWWQFTVRPQQFAGRIDSVTQSSFLGDKPAGVTVWATYTGDSYADAAVKLAAVPSGWTGVTSDPQHPASIRISGMANGQQGPFGQFSITAPASGGSGSIVWELWQVSGIEPIRNFDAMLTNYVESVTALDFEPPVLLSPTNNAADTGVRPLFTWSEVTNAIFYRLVVQDKSFPSPVRKVDAFTTATDYLPQGDELLPNASYDWFVMGCNPLGTNQSAVSTFSTGTNAIQARVIGLEQTADNRLCFEVAVDLMSWIPEAVWLQYHVDGNLWPGIVDITENLQSTPMGDFYYAEIDSGLNVGDTVDVDVGFSPVPLPLALGAASFSPPLHLQVENLVMNLEVADAGRGYIRLPQSGSYTTISPTTGALTLQDLTIENTLACWARLYATNQSTGNALTGGAGDLPDAFSSSPSWLQIAANWILGKPAGPVYLGGRKVDFFNLISINTLLGNPSIYDSASFKYLSTETLPENGLISIRAFKGGSGDWSDCTDLLALNAVDTFLDFIPIFKDDIFQDQTGAMQVITTNLLTLAQDVVQETAVLHALESGDTTGAATQIFDDLMGQFIDAEALLKAALESAGIAEADAEEMAKSAVTEVEIGQAIGNSIARWWEAVTWPPEDTVWLQARRRGLNFQPDQVALPSAGPLAFSLGAGAVTNCDRCWQFGVGQNGQFEFLVTNTSSEDTIYNVWMVVDLYAPTDLPRSGGLTYSYETKVENTHTPIPDYTGTGRQGRIYLRAVEINGAATNLDYAGNADVGLTRFLDLAPGDTVRFMSDPYPFTTSTNNGTVFTYQPGRYMAVISIWRNGYPGQTKGIVATNVFNCAAVPVYLTGEALPPGPMGLTAANAFGSILLGWDPIPRLDVQGLPINRDVEAVAIYRATDAGSVYASDDNVIAIRSANDPNQMFADTNVLAGQVYYYGAKAINSGAALSTGSPVVSASVASMVLVVSSTNLAATATASSNQWIGRFAVANHGLEAMPVLLTASPNWLTTSAAGVTLLPTGATNVDVWANVGLLPPGCSYGTITLTASGAQGSPTSVGITVTNLTTLPHFSMTNFTKAGPNLSVTIVTASNANYVLEFKNSLTDAAWTTAQVQSGTGGALTLTDNSATGPARFYRVRIQ